MDKTYDHKTTEDRIYKMWEEAGAFKPFGSAHGKPFGSLPPEADKQGKPFSIIMPPPNANGELHLGHAIFVAVSDALIRYHRMRGEPTLWLPGVDHAGILTQVTFEKKLRKEQDKSRYDLGREEFVKQCYKFCMDNKMLMENQLRALGASCDWQREKFTMDPQISQLVLETFIKMHREGLVYRGFRIVNWCPRCRSTLADLELEWKEQEDQLYFVRYPKTWEEGYVIVATTRVEPIWLDTHLAVNPTDKKNLHLIGKNVKNPLTGKDMKIIGDEFVDPKFGTGVVKLTPAHDSKDYQVAIKHNIPIKNGIDFDGKLTSDAGQWAGLKTKVARQLISEYLSKNNLLEKIVPFKHEVAVCERCATTIEPLVSRQWFVSIKPLAKRATTAVETGKVKIIPKKYEAMYFNWMKNIRDWPISRQIWWGQQLPVWYGRSSQKTTEQIHEFELLKKGDTRSRTDVLESPIVSQDMPAGDDEYIQDPDTFDTWFSSGQWPVNTLKNSDTNDFKHFYPTTVMNTAYEILFLWVARMIMFGLYLTDEVPFQVALINGVLRDEKGQKMSKSKSNGINPNEAIAKYGADAVRMALLAGRDSGNDLLISKQQMEERIRGYRNFSNKLWNIGRFVSMQFTDGSPVDIPFYEDLVAARKTLHPQDRRILSQLTMQINRVTKALDNYNFGEATSSLYEFTWHTYADWYLENLKLRIRTYELEKKHEETAKTLSVMRYIYFTILKLLHPFMPFVTEEIWHLMPIESKNLLITASWPTRSED